MPRRGQQFTLKPHSKCHPRLERQDEVVRGKLPHLNAEFQTIAKRDQKAFLSDQCKEIEENNRMGKTSDLFKKIRDTKGPFQGEALFRLVKSLEAISQDSLAG